MYPRLISTRAALLLPLLVLTASAAKAQTPLTTAFTYQGRLKNAGSPANGLYDLRFSLYSAPTGGAPVGPTLCADNVTVTEGLFTASLDFGAQFTGQERFLQIEVRADTGLTCANATGFVALTPRQPLAAAPYALWSPRTAVADSLALPSSAAAEIGGGTALSITNSSQEEGSNTFAALTASLGSTAVLGHTTGPESKAIDGVADGPDSTAVHGIALSLSGSNTGVSGTAVGPASTGVSGFALSPTGANYGGYFRSASPMGLGLYSENTALAGGSKVELSGPHGAINTNGYVYREYAPAARSCAIPIAFGNIAEDGTINSGTGNFACTHSQTTSGEYDITIAGLPYTNAAFAVSITPGSGGAPIVGNVTAAPGGTGAMRVSIWVVGSGAGPNGKIDHPFHFVVFKADP